MTKKTEAHHQKPIKSHAPPATAAGALQKKEEAKEVAGRHQNDGQKHFKGAR